RELWARVVSPGTRSNGEAVVPVPGEAGEIVRLGLHLGGGAGGRFAWGRWRAPRLLGAGEAEEGAVPPSEGEEAGGPLREVLAGSNVLLIVLDAARASELGTYGYARETTPEIDRIAAEGVVFERAFTPAVYTLGAMSSVWTSEYPDRHHSAVSFAARLPADRLTLAELLSSRGIVTAGFVANAVAGVAFGFERGFSEFRETFKDFGSGADGILKAVPEWVRSHAERRFFAYLHFREPHFPYDPPAPFDTRFGPDGPIPKAARRDMGWINDLGQGRREPRPGEIEHLRRLYDGNVSFADHEIGRLRRFLEEQGLWDRTLVIVTADHGEELFEHRWIGHNVHLYEESIHVPLVLRFPKGKGPAGKRLSALVDLLDVAPTVADVFGILGTEAGRRRFQGRSLIPVVTGAPGKNAILSRTVWDRPRYALRDAHHKFVFDTRSGEEQLYDLDGDPGETHNLAAAEPIRAAYYRQSLHRWVASLATPGGGGGGGATVTHDQCENLRALGYVGTCR
ncbi:MAG TPA: sulfatase, partial [Vicinamibacteria bacterium]